MKSINKNEEIMDMTQGNPMKMILGFAIPLFGGMLFQQFYNLVDTMIVGRFLGVNALAGVGSTGSLNFMVLGFCMGVCGGFAIPVSQRFGAKDFPKMRSFFANSIYLTGIFAVALTLLVCLLCSPVLRLMNTPAEIFDYARNYIFVIFLGIPFTLLYNLMSSVIRAIGDSKAPVLFLVIASVLNIGLDLLLIISFGMGVEGAALATVISQAVAGLLSVVYIRKKLDILHIHKDESRPDGKIMEKLLSMGLPMGLQYSITAIGTVILQTAINGLGSVAVAAMTAGTKIHQLFGTPFEALGSTMATYGGQNVGAGKTKRLDEGLRAAILVGWVYSIGAFLVMFFFGAQLSGLFVEGEPELIGLSRSFLVYTTAFYFLLTLVNTVRFMIQGIGYPGLATLAGFCELAGRMIAALILIPIFGFTGACLAHPIAWVFADIFLLLSYRNIRKKLDALFGIREETKEKRVLRHAHQNG